MINRRRNNDSWDRDFKDKMRISKMNTMGKEKTMMSYLKMKVTLKIKIENQTIFQNWFSNSINQMTWLASLSLEIVLEILV